MADPFQELSVEEHDFIFQYIELITERNKLLVSSAFNGLATMEATASFGELTAEYAVFFFNLGRKYEQDGYTVPTTG